MELAIRRIGPLSRCAPMKRPHAQAPGLRRGTLRPYTPPMHTVLYVGAPLDDARAQDLLLMREGARRAGDGAFIYQRPGGTLRFYTVSDPGVAMRVLADVLGALAATADGESEDDLIGLRMLYVQQAGLLDKLGREKEAAAALRAALDADPEHMPSVRRLVTICELSLIHI